MILKMAVKFLNVTPEEAVVELNNLIVEGYEIKVGLDTEYHQTKKAKGGINNSSVEELIARWDEKANEWFNRTLQTLEKLYTTKRHMYELREAREKGMSLLSTDDSGKWSSLSKNMGAKVEKLNEFDDFIKREFRIEYIAGDKVEGNKYQQDGDGNTQQVHK